MTTMVKKFKEWALGRSAYNAKGEEIPDPTPLEMPVGFEKPQSLAEIMGALLNRAVQEELHGKGAETFEEADDFEVEDDEPIQAPWQDEMGPAWTREAEIRAGQVQIPDYESARLLREKANAVLANYNPDGSLKKPAEVGGEKK